LAWQWLPAIKRKRPQNCCCYWRWGYDSRTRFEGLNHAGVADADLLVILNDNCMSIDPNVGALKEYLTDITTSPVYTG